MNERCKNCPLANSPYVCGFGNPKAPIVIVGRNPGNTEVETGVPFTGPSGQLLDAALHEVGIQRGYKEGEVYLTNAVKCRVPGDKPPTKAMFDACRADLLEELKYAKVIVSFGTEATESLLGKVGGIMSIVGSFHKLGEAVVLPSFHPAYIIRGAIDAYDDFEDTLRRAKGLIDGTVPFPESLPYDKVHYLTDADSILDILSSLETFGPFTLAIDTETKTVRDPDFEILLVQLSDGVDAWVFEASAMDETCDRIFQEMLDDPVRTWIFHNAEFDLQVLYHHWQVWARNVEDTMMLGLCLTEKLNRVGLKRLVNMYLSVPHYEEEIHTYLRSSKDTFDMIPRKVLVPYAGFDAIYTFRLFNVLREKVREEGNYHLYNLLKSSQETFAMQSYEGTKVDLGYVQALRDEYYPLLEKLESQMQIYAYDLGYDSKDAVKAAKTHFLSVNSPKQLLYFANHQLGLSTDTTDHTFLEKYAKHEFIQMLSQFRDVYKLVGTYIDGIADDVWPDGRVHPDFIHGAVTGRLTVKNPPLQTLPREGSVAASGLHSIKKLFVSGPGYTLIHCDYSQLEMRVAWHITQDEALGEAIMSSDFHRIAAAAIFRKKPEEVTKEERNRGKFVTFGVMYGRQAYSLTIDLKCSVAEAQVYLENFFERFPKFHAWFKQTQIQAVDTGLLTTEYGRRRRWKLITPDMEQHIKNEAVNFPIQSTASDICLSSMIKLNQLLHKNEWGRVLFSVHDSIEFEVLDEHIDDAAKVIKEVMEHPFPSCATFEIDMETGFNLGEMQKYKS